MNKKLFKYSIIGFVFVSALGSFCHFIYELSGFNLVAGLLCPINESIWEHLKLLYFPYLIWTIIEYFLTSKKQGIFAAKYISALFGMLIIVSFYYTYSGIIGKDIEIVNILSFFIGVASSFGLDYILINSNKFQNKNCDIFAIILFIISTAVFFCFTIAPPFLPIFKDPLSLTYGI